MTFLEFIARKTKDIYSYRSDFTIYENFKINRVLSEEFRNLVFSSDGLNSRLLTENDMFLSETLMKSYPTDKLSTKLAKTITGICDSESILFGKMMNGHTIKYDGKLVSDCTEADCSDNTADLFMRISYRNVSDNVAGSVIYGVFSAKSEILKKLTKNVSKLAELGHVFGYNYVSSNLDHEYGVFQFIFESMFQHTSLDISDMLYHIAPTSVKDKILKYGIVPKSKTKNGGTKMEHPDRVYLFNVYDRRIFENFAIRCRKTNVSYENDRLKRKRSFTLFSIDKTRIRNLVLYRDNMFQSANPLKPTALYTYDVIPPYAISELERFEI